MVYLRSMPRLKALGVGDASNADAGVAALASLSNLEVLALKGGPALTDKGLNPWRHAQAPRPGDLPQPDHGAGLVASLYACKKLDSVQIKSSVPVSAQAVARLQTELPSLRTVDITQPEPSMRPRPVQTARAALIR